MRALRANTGVCRLFLGTAKKTTQPSAVVKPDEAQVETDLLPAEKLRAVAERLRKLNARVRFELRFM